ncbi:hypothetical protein N7509_011622 [Penicillium cosmopolitanum]|uniref:Uncharacterized protein n=1 Tax=Penicillium cosmopolitanum TaxID=1131564 RepID=A0A9W9VDV0_9EURO|nr:uncharacterized protein N7509_011622 [Penicillium cosmopolitanum]KAJ5378503.1 hypothetical protein N7509_011622 [Penicillium cosmopolitanum]
MFTGGLGLSAIPLSGWRSKQRPREMDAFDELSPKHAETQKRTPTLIRLSKSVYLGVISHRSTSSRPTNARQNVRSRRKNMGQQSPWDPRTNQSDQQCLISDSRHESRMPRAEHGRLLVRVTDEEKAMSVTETPEKHRDRSLTNGPGHCHTAQTRLKAPGKRLYRAASRNLRWR